MTTSSPSFQVDPDIRIASTLDKRFYLDESVFARSHERMTQLRRTAAMSEWFGVEVQLISPETARTHVQHVLGKLGVHSRLEAAAFVSRNGIRDECWSEQEPSPAPVAT